MVIGICFTNTNKKKVYGALVLIKKQKKIFIAPNNLELEILIDQLKLNQ